MFMLGAGYTLLEDGHVRVDIYYSKASSVIGAGRWWIFSGHLFPADTRESASLALLVLADGTQFLADHGGSRFRRGGHTRHLFLLKSLIPGVLRCCSHCSVIVNACCVTSLRLGQAIADRFPSTCS